MNIEAIRVGSEGDFTLNLVERRGEWSVYIEDQAYVEASEASEADCVRIRFAAELEPLRELLHRCEEIYARQGRVTEDYEERDEEIFREAKKVRRAVEQLLGSFPRCEEIGGLLLEKGLGAREAEWTMDLLESICAF